MSKTPEERKAYMREYMANKRAEKLTDDVNKTDKVNKKAVNLEQSVNNEPKVNMTVKPQEIDHSIFEGKGHGVPGNGYVLISGRKGEPSYAVTEGAWKDRLATGCKHGLAGWSCKLC